MSSPAYQFTAADVRGAQLELGRRHLLDFCGIIEIPGAPIDEDADDETLVYAPIEYPQAAHHLKLIDLCERLERGITRRAMVFMPPGSAKSTYASVVFPAWFMGRMKRRNVGVATYATDLARKVGRRIRSIVRQPVYRDMFDTGLSGDQAAANEWALDNGNEFMGAGILAGWTGNRLDGLVIDDPVKNREEADSPVIQEKVVAEFNDSLKSRLKPGGWVLIIQTRWNENDLSGSLLPEDWDGESGEILCRDGLVWEVLCIPAEAEENDVLGRAPGEMLWKEWFGRDPDFWTAARRNVRTWSALYQQRPAPADGSFFHRAWFDGGVVDGREHPRRRYKPGTQPQHLRKYLTSDHAPTDGEDSDPNVCRVWGLDESGDVWMLGGFNAIQKMDVTADRIIALMKDHKPFAWFPEDDNNYKSAEPFILRQMKKDGVAVRIAPMSPHGQDKAAKAQSFQGLAAIGAVWIPEGPDGDAVINEFVKFPAGKHDEEVDCAGIIGRAIAMAHPALVPPEDKPQQEPRGISNMTWDELMAQQQERREDRV